jgi:hypothetical protein
MVVTMASGRGADELLADYSRTSRLRSTRDDLGDLPVKEAFWNSQKAPVCV